MSHEIPVTDVLAAIGFDQSASIMAVRGGADALLWRVTTDNGVYALRLLRTDQRAQTTKEVTLSQWIEVHDDRLSVPSVIQSGTWNDRPAYLMTWVDGQTLGEVLLSESLDEATVLHLGVSFGETQARIHALPILSDLQRFSPSWIDRLNNVDLAKHAKAIQTSRSALLHLDFHPLNIMVNNGEIVAVLDWANAAVGDPQFDLARTQAIIELAPIPAGTDTSPLESFLKAWRSGYEHVAGPIEIDPVAYWWAGALIEHELTPRVGNPALPWLDDAHIRRVHAWTNQFRS